MGEGIGHGQPRQGGAEQLGTWLWGVRHCGLRGKERGGARGRRSWRHACQKRSSCIGNSRCSRERGPVVAEQALIRIHTPLESKTFAFFPTKYAHEFTTTSLPDSAGWGYKRRLVLTSRDERWPSSRRTNLRLSTVSNRSLLRNASRHFSALTPTSTCAPT